MRSFFLNARFWVFAAIYLGLIVSGVLVGRYLMQFTEFEVRPGNEPEVHWMITSATVAYVVAAAVPFVPGAEIGLALIVAFGKQIVPLVYLSMVLALTFSYLIGRLIPPTAVAAGFRLIGLSAAANLILNMAPLDVENRLQFLLKRVPNQLLPFMLRHRYLALAVAINLPGNTLLGGGGGIALGAGMSGLYSFTGYLMTILLAVSPVPLVIFLGGT